MRKLIMLNLASVDGCYAGADGNVDWHNPDEEVMEYCNGVLNGIDTMLFGRITYELYESYWPLVLDNPDAPEYDRVAARRLGEVRKIVYSKSKKESFWRNSELRSTFDPEEIKRLKKQDGKDMLICGSGTIVHELTNHGLIDEYQFIVTPVILGAGRRIFGYAPQIELKNARARLFNSGHLLVVYQKA
jgi:dihydrofolate reductase